MNKTKKHIFEEIQELNIPYSNHYSDLYIPVTEQTTRLINKHNKKPSIFLNQITKTDYYDLKFDYLPFWNKK